MAGVWGCVAALMVCVCVWGPSVAGQGIGGAVSGVRIYKPRSGPKKPKPVNVNLPAQNIDIQRMTGTWYLLITASKCSYLINHGTKVEPTVVSFTRPSESDQTLSVSTKTRHNHQCWEILEAYSLSTPGKLTLKAANPDLNTEITVADTDYNSYAIIYYQKQGKVAMKLYTRSVDALPEPLLLKFEQLAEKQNMGLAYLFPFPTYSHCGTVNKDHIINCVPTC